MYQRLLYPIVSRDCCIQSHWNPTFPSFSGKPFFYPLAIVATPHAVRASLIKSVSWEPGTVPAPSCNFSFNPCCTRGSEPLTPCYRWKGSAVGNRSRDPALAHYKGLACDHLISYYLIFISQLSELSFDLRLLCCLFSLASNHGISSNACAFSH